mmetsp:Transcript_26507/g.47863  ORF Transcript_26507/g.47863 Transcript_26507/m.47863 type:complete len:307 (+) Transcript_26507:3190-4110(+)
MDLDDHTFTTDCVLGPEGQSYRILQVISTCDSCAHAQAGSVQRCPDKGPKRETRERIGRFAEEVQCPPVEFWLAQRVVQRCEADGIEHLFLKTITDARIDVYPGVWPFATAAHNLHLLWPLSILCRQWLSSTKDLCWSNFYILSAIFSENGAKRTSDEHIGRVERRILELKRKDQRVPAQRTVIAKSGSLLLERQRRNQSLHNLGVYSEGRHADGHVQVCFGYQVLNGAEVPAVGVIARRGAINWIGHHRSRIFGLDLETVKARLDDSSCCLQPETGSTTWRNIEAAGHYIRQTLHLVCRWLNLIC